MTSRSPALDPISRYANALPGDQRPVFLRDLELYLAKLGMPIVVKPRRR